MKTIVAFLTGLTLGAYGILRMQDNELVTRKKKQNPPRMNYAPRRTRN